MREWFLRALAKLACRHYGWVLLVATLLTIAALTPLMTSGYSSSFNVARMLPQEIPASRAFTHSLTDFGTADEAVVVFRLDPKNPEQAIETAGPLAERIAARLRKHPDINSAFAQLLTEQERDQLLNQELPKRGLLFLPASDIELIKKKLEPEEIARNVSKTARILRSGAASGGDTQKTAILNILGLASVFRESFEKILTRDSEDGAYQGNYIVAPDRSMLLLVIAPKIPAQSLHFAHRIMDELEEITYEEMEGASPLRPDDLSPTAWRTLLESWRTDGPPTLGRMLYRNLPEDSRTIYDTYLSNTNSDTAAEDFFLLLRHLNRQLRTDLPTQALAKSTHPRASDIKELLQKETSNIDSDAKALALRPSAIRAARILRLNRRLIRLDDDVLPASDAIPMSQAAKQTFKIEFGGGYAIARAYASKLNGVLISTLLLSGTLVLLFFGYSFRRFGVLLFVGVPLLMIVCWTIGFGWILFEQLNLISCAFAAVLIGLGVDYGVHIYNRYIEERILGANIEDSFCISLAHTGWGVLIGMVTTCLAFVALHATRFSQLAEFGVLSGIGVALSVPAMMLVMPALIAWRGTHGTERVAAMRPATFFLPSIAKLVEARPRLVATIGILVACFCIIIEVGLPDALVFDPRMSNLRPKDRSFVLNGEIAAAFAKRNPNKLTFMITAKTEREALDIMADYEQKLDALEKAGLILGYESVTRYLPTPEEQLRRMAVIRTIDFDRARKAFSKALAAEKMNERPFAFNFRLLAQHQQLARSGDIILPSTFENSKIARLVSGYVSKRRRDYYIDDGVYPTADHVTLAKAAQTRDGDHVRYPAEATLSLEQVRAMNDPNQPYGKRVNPITVYEGGWAIKAAVFPVIPEGSDTGEPVITDEWIEQITEKLDLPPAIFAATADATDYNVTLTGVAVVGKVLGRVVKEDFLKISVWIFGISLLVVNLFYHRKPLRAILCMVPLCLGILYLPAPYVAWQTANMPLVAGWFAIALLLAWGALFHRRFLLVIYCFLPVCLGLIYLLGGVAFYNIIVDAVGLHGWRLDMNFVNVLTVPIIIGVGIDNGIHLVNRYFEDGRQVRPVIVDTGRALAITALTSMFGFGSLYLAKFQGLGSMASLGILSVLALAMVLLSSVLVFPAILATFSPARGTDAPRNEING